MIRFLFTDLLLMRIAYCVLRIAYCVWHIPYCVLRIAYCVLRIAYGVLLLPYCVFAQRAPGAGRDALMAYWVLPNRAIYLFLFNPKSEIRNPKSEIRNPKSEIRNPKSEILYGVLARLGNRGYNITPLYNYNASLQHHASRWPDWQIAVTRLRDGKDCVLIRTCTHF